MTKKSAGPSIIAQSPTRVDLAGGTLDMWPLYLFHKNCVTANLAIEIYTRATIIPRSDRKISLRSLDTGVQQNYANLEALEKNDNRDLMLLKVHAEYWKPKQGFDLITQSESPVGGGIAASSSLNISLCGAFQKFTGQKMSKESLVSLAGNLEAKVISTPTGCQDYFPALFGGLNLIELTDEGPKRSKVAINMKQVAERLTLVYTGRPHHSGLNNWQIYKSHIEGDKVTFANLERVRDVALEMKKVLLKKDLKGMTRVFRDEYDARIALSPVFTSPEIERLKKLSEAAGGEAIKICGAGGGGCVFLWSQPNKKSILEEECKRAGFQILRAKPTEVGLVVKTSSRPIVF